MKRKGCGMYNARSKVWDTLKGICIALTIILVVGLLIWNAYSVNEQCRADPHPSCAYEAYWDGDECACTDEYGAEIEWDPGGIGSLIMRFIGD